MATSATSPVRRSVAVLGLGRMGRAMEQRLTEQGWAATGWTRSDGAGGGPRQVVEGVDLVVLALFDGPACAQVLERCCPGLAPGTVVVNTSTVAPHEASALESVVRARGAGYVHAPVLGSVPAVLAGTLQVLASGPERDLAAATPLLTSLGQVLPVGDAAAAAGLKLVAGGALGGALLAVRDSRQHAAELGVDPALALDVLERGPLGALVRAKRARLGPTGAGAPAEFAIAALAKDLALLAAESPAARSMSALVSGALASGALAPDSDIAAVTEPSAHAVLADELPDYVPDDVPDEVLTPLTSYIRGHATGDPSHFRRAFLPSAHVEGLRDGEFVSWSLEDYCALFAGRPAPDEPTRRRRIEQVSVEGSVGTATMTLWHGPDTFTDVFLLVRADDGWRIANKAYHRLTSRPQTSSRPWS